MAERKSVRDITRDAVRVGDALIEFEVRRSTRRKKTVQITLKRGEVVVAAPSQLGSEEVREIVRKRAPWILRHTLEEAAAPSPLNWTSGEKIPFLGRDVPLEVVQANVRSPRVRYDRRRFRIYLPRDTVDADRADQIRGLVEAWYRTRAESRLAQYVDRWWGRLGRGDRSPILIRNQKRRWGSCSTDGKIRLNWRLMMIEPSLIEYIVVHELAHLTHMNHSKDFWDLVSRVMPDVGQRRQRLREVERRLPL